MMQLKHGAYYIIIYSLILVIVCQSCVNHKELVALNSAQEEMEEGTNAVIDQRAMTSPEQYKIHPRDLLIININTFEGNTAQFLQREFSSNDLNNNGGREYGPDALYYNSYQVDYEGYIFLPLLEKIHVAGKTTNEIKIELDTAYATFFKFSSANVKLANMRVSVLGEVNNPGVQYYYNDETTILEAIGMAGDFTAFGNRKKVRLMRKTAEGSESVMLNLYTADFINTPYFFVKPNDIIYIEPIKAKAFDVEAETVGIVLSAISTAILLATLVIDINNK